ncbi:redoxin domain-containing protein [Roseitranquillus sediminis]|uniref:redoxin domain-containing protein n=1 Tax=Roseitranquillus sediminis TaxID=2809051 RepID=UPI001D0C3DC6|nr:redoxin domain-containing protein [Roseitranquillus sediminis]MBM9593690.1 redoxin domain-containing protein [Roseitranquillus sediminis]
MGLRLGDVAPDFTAETTEGALNFYEWMGDGYAVLFSHPRDFTPVCTTELAAMAGLMEAFAQRRAKVIGISVDPVDDHYRWKRDIERLAQQPVTYPIAADPQMKVAKLYRMLPIGEKPGPARAPSQNATVRAVYVVGPDKRIKLILCYPMTTGRNFAEILRALDSIRLMAEEQVATPANWWPGDEVILTNAISDADAAARYGTFERKLPYLRMARPRAPG